MPNTLPTVPSTLRCGLRWSDGIGHYGSRLFFNGGNPPFTSPDLNGFATAISTAWGANLAQDVTNSIFLVEVDLLDISTHNGLIGTWIGSKQGTSGATQLASNLCVNIETQITHHYRGGHPVLHHPPPTQSQLQDTRTWRSTFCGGVATHFQAFLTACAAYTSTTVTGMSQVILLGYRAGNPPPPPTTWTPIGYKVPTRVGTMRRRVATEG